MWAALGRSWCVRSAAGRAGRRWGGGSSEARRPRPFGTAPAGQGGNGDDGGSPGPDASAIRWRPGARRRPLSPLERVSRLLPQDALAQEVWELREAEGRQGAGDIGGAGGTPGEWASRGKERDTPGPGESQETGEEAPAGGGRVPGGSVPPGGPPLRPGELVLAEFRRKGRLEFRKMFLLSERGRLQSNSGSVRHSEVVGCPSGAFVPSSIGHPLLLRRPSLEEYVLLMRRGPAIAYPKVALDMLDPQVVLPTVLPHLRQGAVCAVYLANITQVVDLLEGVRRSRLPLLCERVIEVTHRDWFLAPVIKKDGSYALRVFPSGATDHGEEELGSEEESASCDQEEEELGRPDSRPVGPVPYIARPHHEQGSHTAFLVKLRKVVPRTTRDTPEISCPRDQAQLGGSESTGTREADCNSHTGPP
ncbi:tRNA (adenine(58)-N(1))-methyltransferase, mitochondrial isoform X2 [Lepisosteus oculatus]|uniref:tRNA (adenine(58)-N(1))-methyltransferase, mitochondrial isoform X2 n=1 Tax=Lepisosteus oculatus TaxID=7918 RepID=UPI0035F50C42